MSPARSSRGATTSLEEERQYFRLMEGLLFWIERLGFAILVLSWLIRPTLWDSLVGRDGVQPAFVFWIETSLCCMCISLARLYWGLDDKLSVSSPHCSSHKTSLPYNNAQGVTPLARHLKGKDKEQKPFPQEQSLSLLKSPGFWLERLALLILLQGIIYRRKDNPRGDLIVNTCFMVIFPLLNIYYAWFSYFNEFNLELPSGVQGIAGQELELNKNDVIESNKQGDTNMDSKVKSEHMHERNQESDHDGSLNKAIARQGHEFKSNDVIESHEGEDKNMESNLVLEHKHKRNQESDYNDDHRVSEVSKASNAKVDLGMSECLDQDDRILRMHIKLINALDENYQRRLDKMEDAREKRLAKVIQKYEEDNQKLNQEKEDLLIKFCSANASAQLYRTLLHENHDYICSPLS